MPPRRVKLSATKDGVAVSAAVQRAIAEFENAVDASHKAPPEEIRAARRTLRDVPKIDAALEAERLALAQGVAQRESLDELIRDEATAASAADAVRDAVGDIDEAADDAQLAAARERVGAARDTFRGQVDYLVREGRLGPDVVSKIREQLAAFEHDSIVAARARLTAAQQTALLADLKKVAGETKDLVDSVKTAAEGTATNTAPLKGSLQAVNNHLAKIADGRSLKDVITAVGQVETELRTVADKTKLSDLTTGLTSVEDAVDKLARATAAAQPGASRAADAVDIPGVGRVAIGVDFPGAIRDKGLGTVKQLVDTAARGPHWTTISADLAAAPDMRRAFIGGEVPSGDRARDQFMATSPATQQLLGAIAQDLLASSTGKKLGANRTALMEAARDHVSPGAGQARAATPPVSGQARAATPPPAQATAQSQGSGFGSFLARAGNAIHNAQHPRGGGLDDEPDRRELVLERIRELVRDGSDEALGDASSLAIVAREKDILSAEDMQTLALALDIA